jgi:hypothetical protein
MSLLRHTAASGQQPTEHTAPMVSRTAVIAAGLTSVTIAAITSYFGWPGALLGTAFSAMVQSMIQAVYQGYLDSLARVMFSTDRPAPPPLGPLADRPPLPPLSPTSRARRSPRRLAVSATSAFAWFSFRTSPERRRSILSRGLRAGAAVTIVGLGILTAVELWLGGNLPCYIWNTDCSPAGINPPSILAPFYTLCGG